MNAVDEHILDTFHPAVRQWFAQHFQMPTTVQTKGWSAIATGQHTLIAAPTGAGKTLTGFLRAINDLIIRAEMNELPEKTQIVYISPLKALGNDVERNLHAPLQGITANYHTLTGDKIHITTAVRNGDTPNSERQRMVRKPPHILVTTPEGLYALVTSQGGRSILEDVRTVIVDEIHALAPDLRGTHLAITLERLQELVAHPLQRIGLSATQKPIEIIAKFLVGNSDDECLIVDEGHHQQRDIQIETAGSPLEAVMSNEVWDEVYDRIAEYSESHKTILVFVNSRRLCERVAHHLGMRVGGEWVSAHHGSLSTPLRHYAEQQLKAGQLKILVATASLELGIDIGDVDLVIQLGSTKRIAMFLQRVGRSNHWHGGIPKARLIPLSRDELIECVALMRAVDKGELDRIEIPQKPMDVLAQQIVASAVAHDWHVDALFALMQRAYPYRDMTHDEFETILEMLASGFPTEYGRRGQLIHFDRTNGQISARKRAKMVTHVSGGTIPDSSDYTVRLQPQGVTVGAIAEDFAIYQFPGNILQLGSSTWRILQVKDAEVHVESAPDEAPYMPVWFGELPARSPELSEEISVVRDTVAQANTPEEAIQLFGSETWLEERDARQLVDYLSATAKSLKTVPNLDKIVAERFADGTGDKQLIIHSPLGVRINRAWGLALRHVLGVRFGFALQAAAIDDALLLSLPPDITFPMTDLFKMVKSDEVYHLVEQALLDAPMFKQHWRWVTGRALVVPRQNGGKRVPPHIQRTHADELLFSAFPAYFSRNPFEERPIPNHPLVRQAIDACLHDAMDVDGLVSVLQKIELGTITMQVIDTLHPSPAAFQIIVAKPPSFLDNVPLVDRKARNVNRAPRHLSIESDVMVSHEAIDKVSRELEPDLQTLEDLADYLTIAGILTASDIATTVDFMRELEASGNATRFEITGGRILWADANQVPKIAAAFPEISKPAEDIDPVVALANVLKGRMETSPPKTAQSIAQELGRSLDMTISALEQLQDEGVVLRGAYNPDDTDTEMWCDRRVLSRIHRLTRNKLRAEIEPVTLQQLYRFFLRWQGLTPNYAKHGHDGIVDVLSMLDGLELPVIAWESEILPSRIAQFTTRDLDDVFLSGQFGWGRLSRNSENTSKQLSKITPMSIFDTEHREIWRGLLNNDIELELSPSAGELLAVFEAKSPAFIQQIAKDVRLMSSQMDTALKELVALGLITADNFAGLRHLIEKPNSRVKASRIDVLKRANVGRWSMLPEITPVTDPVERNQFIETYARTVLNRYGVVVRRVIQRENSGVRWYELLRVLRRMEARGEIRGGYFVDGAGGEHFALPTALSMLHDLNRNEATGELVGISAADPLNFTGLLTNGDRIGSRTTTRILLRDAIPIATDDNGKVTVFDSQIKLSSNDLSLLTQSASYRTAVRDAG